MKQLLCFACLFQATVCFGRINGDTGLKQTKNALSKAFSKISYWGAHKETAGSYDSLAQANKYFEQLLLQSVQRVPGTISFPFKRLADSGLVMVSSEDSLLRIYSWNTQSGGSMHVYRNVFQYRDKKEVHSKGSVRSRQDNGTDPGCFYHGLNQIKVRGKTYYIAQCTAVGSSALTLHTIKIFAINNATLNDTAKLIRTQTGLRNELSYEVDFSTSANRNNPDARAINHSTHYDPSAGVITIPLLEYDGKLSTRKIYYRFTGTYFEKTAQH